MDTKSPDGFVLHWSCGELFALTGYGQPEDRRKALQAGFDAHLVKPLDFEQLAFMIEPRGQTPLQ